MGNLKLNLLGKNKDFDVYINGERLKRSKSKSYELKGYNRKVDIKLVQNNIYDNEKWLINSIAEYGLVLSGGSRGYSDFKETRDGCKARCEGVATIGGEEAILNIKLNETKVNLLPLQYTYNFSVNIEGEDSEWNERINNFESPEYLKEQWNIIRIPYVIAATLLIILLIKTII